MNLGNCQGDTWMNAVRTQTFSPLVALCYFSDRLPPRSSLSLVVSQPWPKPRKMSETIASTAPASTAPARLSTTATIRKITLQMTHSIIRSSTVCSNSEKNFIAYSFGSGWLVWSILLSLARGFRAPSWAVWPCGEWLRSHKLLRPQSVMRRRGCACDQTWLRQPRTVQCKRRSTGSIASVRRTWTSSHPSSNAETCSVSMVDDGICRWEKRHSCYALMLTCIQPNRELLRCFGDSITPQRNIDILAL